uniref:hypothetical protein n=1 Tax=uncultured Rothia sp. TaxID=316088 RepID=UPI0025E5186F|nr:hypothetical protein [uncultured Rothia sp.]
MNWLSQWIHSTTTILMWVGVIFFLWAAAISALRGLLASIRYLRATTKGEKYAQESDDEDRIFSFSILGTPDLIINVVMGGFVAVAMWVVMLLRGPAEEALQLGAAILGLAVLLLGLTAMVRCFRRARAKGKKMKPNALLGLMYVTSSGTALSSTLSNGLQTSEHWSMANLIQAGLSAGSTDVDFVNGVMGAYGVPGLVTLAVYTVLFLVWGMLVPEVLLHSVFLTASALGGRAVIVGSKSESAQRLFTVSIALYLAMYLVSSGLLAR